MKENEEEMMKMWLNVVEQNSLLIEKIKEFRKVLVNNAYPGIPIKEDAADPVTMSAWHDYASTNISIKEFDNHFKEELK
jgi:hypothetical protein